jgi:glycerol-3-phosphate dehydrogenase (NAD(P)+)
MNKIRATVLGGGSFGTAVANILANNGHDVALWMRSQDRAIEINDIHENCQYLPGSKLHEGLVATSDMQAAINGADVIYVAIPSKSFRQVSEDAAQWVTPNQILVSTTKGIEPTGFNMMSQILHDVFPKNPIGVLSGPNLAKEVAKGQLAATVVASTDQKVQSLIQTTLSSKTFRVYASDDIYGVEMGGALKNIYAIISGFVDAMGMGENTKSMLITRSLAEMSRFAVHKGANPLTFLGLSGVGDLIATCTSSLSRNYRVGFQMGKGNTLDEAIESLGEVAEGVNTLKFVKEEAEAEGIYMPLVAASYEVLFNGKDIKHVAVSLMTGDHSNDVEFKLTKD